MHHHEAIILSFHDDAVQDYFIAKIIRMLYVVIIFLFTIILYFMSVILLLIISNINAYNNETCAYKH